MTPDSHIVDLGYVAVCTVSVTYVIVGIPINQSNISTWQGNVSTWGIISGANSQYISCTIWIGISQDSTSAFVWNLWYPGQYIGQRFKMRIDVTCTDPLFQTAIEIRKLTWTIDMPDIVDIGTNIAIGADPTNITFAKLFHNSANNPNIQITELSAQSGDKVTLTNQSNTGFTIQIINGGVGVARNINWVALGF